MTPTQDQIGIGSQNNSIKNRNSGNRSGGPLAPMLRILRTERGGIQNMRNGLHNQFVHLPPLALFSATDLPKLSESSTSIVPNSLLHLLFNAEARALRFIWTGVSTSDQGSTSARG